MKLLTVLLVAAATLVAAPTAAFATNAYLSPSGVDTNPCTAASRCLTANRGYQVATPAASVWFAAGTYGAQTIRPDATKAGNLNNVNFGPEVIGSTVITGPWSLGLSGDNGLHSITLTGLNINGTSTQVGISTAGESENDLYFGGVVTEGMTISGSKNVMVTDITSTGKVAIVAGLVGNPGATALKRAESVTITKSILTNDVNGINCLEANAAKDLQVTRNRFQGCWGRDLYVNQAGATFDVTLSIFENNLLFPAITTPFKAMVVEPQGASNLIQYNSAPAQDSDFPSPGFNWPSSNFVVKGNILQLGGCSTIAPGFAVFDYTYFTTTQSPQNCGAHDVSSASAWTAHLDADYKPNSTSPTNNNGDTCDYPWTDFDGLARPVGYPGDVYSDIGARERVTNAPIVKPYCIH